MTRHLRRPRLHLRQPVLSLRLAFALLVVLQLPQVASTPALAAESAMSTLASLSPSSSTFGTGADGALTAAGVVAPNTTRSWATGTAGSRNLGVGGGAGFVAGDEVLVWQTQGSGAGTYEFAMVGTVESNRLVLGQPLGSSYGSPGAQAVRVPQYTDVDVVAGGVLAAPPWDGTTGGVLVFRATGQLTVAGGGLVDIRGKGYRGAPGHWCQPVPAFQGEGTAGPGIRSNSPNGNGGGGGGGENGCGNIGAGGGGGHGQAGAPGHTQGGSTHGLGGNTVGDVEMHSVNLGGGGGGAHSSDGNGGSGSSVGGTGGGAGFVFARTIVVAGQVAADGTQTVGELAEVSTVRRTTSGSGAGGGLVIKGENVDVGASRVTADGGPPLIATGPQPFSGGAGGAGRIRVEYCAALQGTTVPAASIGLFDCEPPATGRYHPLTPARILDTRYGTGGVVGPLSPGATVEVQVTGQGGVPLSGVSAVVMNVAATQPTATGYLTISSAGTTRPLASNLNFTPGKTVPNLAVVQVGTGGRVAMFNAAGTTHVIFDVAGWYSDGPAGGTGNDGRYTPVVPARLLDTRDGTGGGVRLAAGASLEVQVSGRGGVPATGAEAAVLNVAVTGTTATSFLTVHPTGEARPLASNLNFAAGDTLSNRVMAKLGAGGKVTIYNHAGSTDVVVDTGGWFSDASVAGTGGATTALTPARILDTRNGTGGILGPIGSGSTVNVQVTGQGGVPAAGVRAVILNATVVQPSGGGWLTIFPAGASFPLASDLNYAAGETRGNLVVVEIGTDGKVGLYTRAGSHVVFDVVGWVS